MDQPGGHAGRRSLLISLAVSLSGHAALLLFVTRSEAPERPSAPVRQTLTIELAYRVQQDQLPDERDPPRDPAEAVPITPEPGATEPSARRSMPQSAPDQRTLPPSRTVQPAPSQWTLRPLDIRRFVQDYEADQDRPDTFPFRPDLSRRLEARQTEQERAALLARNRADRFGHSSEIVDSDGATTRLGADCYVTSRPLITLQRGQQVTQIDCPGQVGWWKRAGLDEVATFRGIP